MNRQQTHMVGESLKDAGHSSSTVRGFLYAAGSALIVLGVAKLISVSTGSRITQLIDPVFAIPFGQLLTIAALFEIALGVVLWFRGTANWSPALLAWFSTILLAYRVSLWAIDWHTPCACMGSLTQVFGISPSRADDVSKMILACMIVGSYGIVLRDALEFRRRAR